MANFLVRLLKFLVILAPYGILLTLFWADLNERNDIIKINRQDIARYAKVIQQSKANDADLPFYTDGDGLLSNYLKGEILYKEALAFGLDKDDMRIKNRLAGKMYVYYLEIARNKLKMTNKDVLVYFKNHKEDYFIKPTVSFAHVYFGLEDKDRDLTETIAGDKLSELNLVGETYEVASQSGDKFNFQSIYRKKSADYLTEYFGKDFVEQLIRLDPVQRKWYGPIQSKHGLHLVTVMEKTTGRYPRLEEVRAQVTKDTENYMLKKAVEKEMFKIQKEYDIKMDKSLPAQLTSQYMSKQKLNFPDKS